MIPLSSDFEDWKTGTHRWRFTQQSTPSASVRDHGVVTALDAKFGWNTFDFAVIGTLELSAGFLVFDTDKAEVFGDVNLRGELSTSLKGTTVAVFNFMAVYLGPDVRIRFQGQHAIAIFSRSSMILDTELKIRPGTLGGFPGGGFVSTGSVQALANNNCNGPGSTSVRVYVKTLATHGNYVPEIQEIETSADPGQKLQGHFVVLYPGNPGLKTQPIPYDASSYDVERYLENAFPDIGDLHVERDDTLVQTPEIGRLWRLTFLSAVGDVPQLGAVSLLSGLGSKVETRTVREGNQLSGHIRLQFLDSMTRWLRHNSTEDELRQALLEDISPLIEARVSRSDPLSTCLQGSTLPDQSAASSIAASSADVDPYNPTEWFTPTLSVTEKLDSVKNIGDRLCSSGRGVVDGYVWKIQMWTRRGNVEYDSPTATNSHDEDVCATMQADTSQLVGIGAAAEVVDSQCFSVAFGGAGASFTGSGGDGYASAAASSLFGTSDEIDDILGGSGGAGGGMEPIDVFPVVQPTLGGAGAGGIALTAVNDILIGVHGKIAVSGGNGSYGFTAGGGGSGGTIAIASGATINHHGVLEALGGHGGGSSAVERSGGGGGGGRIAVYAQSFSTWGDGRFQVSGGASQDLGRVGQQGTILIKVDSMLSVRIDPSLGAAGTNKSLLVHGSEVIDTSRKIAAPGSYQMSRNGPRFVLDSPSRPGRISYFVRVGNIANGDLSANRGAIFGVSSTNQTAASDANVESNGTSELMIAVGMVDGSFVHEANTFQWPRTPFHDKIQVDRWYKLDITLNWDSNTYSIRLNDVLKVSDASFQGSNVTMISLNNIYAMSTWWDEIYVGENYVGEFECPRIKVTNTKDGDEEGVVVVKKRQVRKLWAEIFLEPVNTTFHPMVRHESHLSRREIYQHNYGGLVPNDGVPHREFFNDVAEHEAQQADGTSLEELDAGSGDDEVIVLEELLTIDGLPLDSTIIEPLETGIDWRAFEPTDDSTVAVHPSVYWYSEWFNETSGQGGVGACSTVDYNEWRNEGIVVHFDNLSDPFGNAFTAGSNGSLMADRPKVIFNTKTNKFVMWMHVDNATNTMGLAGVATSTYPNGPFTFERSFYPDAPIESPGGQSINETRDQTIAMLDTAAGEQRAFLLRSYYKTVEYWLPRPVMDPLWQSVQTPEGETDFGLSYHRAFHHVDYDDPADIYLQRWRMEDTPWEVICCKPTNLSDCESYTEIPATPADICPSGLIKKGIVGQSQVANASSILHSRYKDPDDYSNSFFIPASVPSHTSWGFQVLNVKTWRGNYFDALSTNITLYIFKRYTGAERRREIEADPSIPFEYPNEDERTSVAIPANDSTVMDDLLGTLGVPMSVAFLAKYSTYDLASIDFNSDGKITSAEIAGLEEKRTQAEVTEGLAASLMADFEAMKQDQITQLDADNDSLITYTEFASWLGLDPNLLFDQFDIDKSGYLDENELARLLWFRQVPRLDQAMLLFDPSLDGRVFYQRFLPQLLDTPAFVFDNYDFDGSATLTQDEIDLMVKDLHTAFAQPEVLAALKNSTTNSIAKASYVEWFSTTTSLVDGVRDSLKVDNAVHPTRPDSLTGPLHVVERRRAKYVSISRLSPDYRSTEGLLKEIEGDFEGREALLNFWSFAEELFGLSDAADTPAVVPFRDWLSPAMLHERASYWNGRFWEGRPSAPPLFTYGQQCLNVAGVNESDSGCLPCRTSSPYVTPAVQMYQSTARSTDHCAPQHEMDAYIKAFDQQVAIQLQYQQQAQFGPQGAQPHLSPCYNQSQFFPCDVHKVLDGNVGDTLRDPQARATAWNLAWERHPNNAGSSVKIRTEVGSAQAESDGPSFLERFPSRDRIAAEIDSDVVFAPDQLDDILGGGR